MNIPVLGKNDLIYTYKEQWFNGFAPCFDNGLFSLACCKGAKNGRGMRQSIGKHFSEDRDIWVLSIAGNDITVINPKHHNTSMFNGKYINHQHHDAIYLAKINEVITWSEYVNRFPNRNDCIYRIKGDKIKCINKKHHNDSNILTDCASDCPDIFRTLHQVLLSEEYYVFEAGVTVESGSCLDINRGFAFNEKANTEPRTEALNKLLEANADKIIMKRGFDPFSKS